MVVDRDDDKRPSGFDGELDKASMPSQCVYNAICAREKKKMVGVEQKPVSVWDCEDLPNLCFSC